MTRSGVFLTNLEVFEIPSKPKLNLRRKQRIKIVKIYAHLLFVIPFFVAARTIYL